MSGNSVSGCTTAEGLAPAVWDWGIISLAQSHKEIKLPLRKYFLALKSLRFWGFLGGFLGFRGGVFLLVCLGFVCLWVFCLLALGFFNLSVYYVTFFRNAITSKENEHSVFLCYTDFEAV